VNDTPLDCRFCHCTEDAPCRLVGNEGCVINVLTRCCNAPGCLAAMESLRRRVSRETREAARKLIGTVAQQFIADKHRKREAAQRRLRKFRRAA
jgi:hypothetical protein